METTVEKKLGYYLNTEQAQFLQVCLLNRERYLILEQQRVLCRYTKDLLQCFVVNSAQLAS